ncbi:hypothetical protein QUF90_16190 [Desulfococcaceae bacterium HSG9]|nr:hypothetical protein [Desulfococcaceae bacterium HSG9]
MLKYIKEQFPSDDQYIRNFAEGQKWVATAFIEPAKHAKQLARILSEQVKNDDKAGIVRTVSMMEGISEPLEDAGLKEI